MHETALLHADWFFRTYATNLKKPRIVDIGAQDVNGSLRQVAPKDSDYVGVDFVAGKGVDVIITDPYKLPFEDASVDICVSSSCFEHSEFFWLLFNECLRILKPHGLLYINAPSNGDFHRFPADCWRFYPDSGMALQNWGRRSGFDVVMLESFVGQQKREQWNDFVAVFVRSEAHLNDYPRRILDEPVEYTNGRKHGTEEIFNYCRFAQDQYGNIPRALKRYFKVKMGRS